jgi:hypothetical protein
MQNKGNQTNEKDPDNRGRDEAEMIPEQLRTLWCGREDLNLHPLQDYHLKVARLPFRHVRTSSNSNDIMVGCEGLEPPTPSV